MVYSEGNISLISHVEVTFTMSVKSLVYSRKWIIYALLSLIPILFSLINPRRLGGATTPIDAFLSMTFSLQYGFFYVFGVLLLALPFSSDEITDHIMDLFLIRPVYREVLFFTRYIVLVIANTLLTSILILLYYIYFYTIDNLGDLFKGNWINLFNKMTNRADLNILFGTLIFFFLANLIYSALFLAIGFIGSRGFGIGIFVAILELYFLSYLFLANSPLIPRTNLNIIGIQLIGSEIKNYVPNLSTQDPINNTFDNPFIKLSSYDNAIIYIILATGLLLAMGWFYLRQKEFD